MDPTTSRPLELQTPAVSRHFFTLTLTTWRMLWAVYTIAWFIALEVPVPVDTKHHPEWTLPVFTFSKCVHISAFALFVYLGARMQLPGRSRWLLMAFFFGFAMLSEYVQFLLVEVCHRHGQWSDVGLDSIGILIGVGLSWRYWFKPA